MVYGLLMYKPEQVVQAVHVVHCTVKLDLSMVYVVPACAHACGTWWYTSARGTYIMAEERDSWV
jgi:hypothetical protein